jgi:hypothetical protein
LAFFLKSLEERANSLAYLIVFHETQASRPKNGVFGGDSAKNAKKTAALFSQISEGHPDKERNKVADFSSKQSQISLSKSVPSLSEKPEKTGAFLEAKSVSNSEAI